LLFKHRITQYLQSLGIFTDFNFFFAAIIHFCAQLVAKYFFGLLELALKRGLFQLLLGQLKYSHAGSRTISVKQTIV